jgi:hypothetical protein
MKVPCPPPQPRSSPASTLRYTPPGPDHPAFHPPPRPRGAAWPGEWQPGGGGSAVCCGRMRCDHSGRIQPVSANARRASCGCLRGLNFERRILRPRRHLSRTWGSVRAHTAKPAHFVVVCASTPAHAAGTGAQLASPHPGLAHIYIERSSEVSISGGDPARPPDPLRGTESAGGPLSRLRSRTGTVRRPRGVTPGPLH